MFRQMVLPAVILFGMASQGSVAAAGRDGDSVSLVSHAARYSLSLTHARLGGDVANAVGELTYKFANVCDGWTVESRFSLQIFFRDGGFGSSNVEFLSWESKSGDSYRFSARTFRNEELEEETDGTASIRRGMEGEAIFAKPEARRIALGKGTLFPTAHAAGLIKAALDGRMLQENIVFDGAELMKAYVASAAIAQGTPKPLPLIRDGVDSSLLSGPSWPMLISFFNNPYSLEPDYEMTARYYSNGVANDMVQQFGNFTMKGVLQKLELLPPPDC